MKAKITARFFFVVFSCYLTLSCTQNLDKFSAEENLLNSLSKRFENKDLVSVIPMDAKGSVFEQKGIEFGNLTRAMLKDRSVVALPKSSTTRPIIGITDRPTFKTLTSALSEAAPGQGLSISLDVLDRVNQKARMIPFSSEGITTMLAESLKAGSISSLQHKLITMELQQIASASGKDQVRAISATMTTEVHNAAIPAKEKSLLLLMNSLVRSSLELPQMAVAPGVSFNFDAAQIFHRTIVVAIVVVVVVVVAAVVTVNAEIQQRINQQQDMLRYALDQLGCSDLDSCLQAYGVAGAAVSVTNNYSGGGGATGDPSVPRDVIN